MEVATVPGSELGWAAGFAAWCRCLSTLAAVMSALSSRPEIVGSVFVLVISQMHVETHFQSKNSCTSSTSNVIAPSQFASHTLGLDPD